MLEWQTNNIYKQRDTYTNVYSQREQQLPSAHVHYNKECLHTIQYFMFALLFGNNILNKKY